jgi:hypothetical protein
MPTVSVMAATIELGDAIPNTATPPAAPTNAPIVTLVHSGSQATRFERVMITYSNASGESLPSPEVKIQVPANNVVAVYPQPLHGKIAPGQATGWNCYITTGAANTETKQNTSLLVIPEVIGSINEAVIIGQAFQEPATGLIGGSALPTTATILAGLVSGTTNLVNTPPGTGSLTVADNTNKNTGRTQMAAQAAYAKFSGIS